MKYINLKNNGVKMKQVKQIYYRCIFESEHNYFNFKIAMKLINIKN